MFLSKAYPKDRELHAKICLNPAAASDFEVLASVENLCSGKIVMLPAVKKEIADAKNLDTGLDALGRLLLNPLLMVKRAVFFNNRVLEVAEKSEDSNVLREIAGIEFDARTSDDLRATIVPAKARTANNPNTPLDCVLKLMADKAVGPMAQALSKMGSSERNRPPSGARLATPAPPTGPAVKSPAPATAPRAVPPRFSPPAPTAARPAPSNETVRAITQADLAKRATPPAPTTTKSR